MYNLKINWYIFSWVSFGIEIQ